MHARPLSWSLAAATFSLAIAGAAHAQITISPNTHGNVSCNGGSNGFIVPSVSGGTGSYTYRWTHGPSTLAATGLSAGNYTLTVTDSALATASSLFTITQPPILSATSSQTNVSTSGGNNGSASVSTSGGTPGYTYSWSPSGGTAATATGLAVGTYTVTITDANTCQLTKSFTISEAVTAPAATVTSVGVPANGAYTPGQTLTFTVNFSETVTVNTSGGTPRIALTVGAATRYAAYHSGSGTSSLTFQYTVQPGDVDSDGITVGALGLNGGTILNGSTNVTLTLNNVGATNGVLVAPPPPAPVPTLTEWAMLLLTGLLALFGAARLGLLPAARKE